MGFTWINGAMDLMRQEQEDRSAGWDADATVFYTIIMLMGTFKKEWVIFTAANETTGVSASCATGVRLHALIR